jgi:hypothetical protein
MSSLSPPWLTQCFWAVFAAALLLHGLRGFAVLTMIPGGVLNALWIVAISLGVYLLLVWLR